MLATVVPCVAKDGLGSGARLTAEISEVPVANGRGDKELCILRLLILLHGEEGEGWIRRVKKIEKKQVDIK